jgi:hypothetical protein
VVVFDLDSTLFSTRPRNLAILREFAQAHPEVPGLVDAVSEIVADDFRWDVTAPLRARGVGGEPLFVNLKRYWLDRFFTDEYVMYDTPMLGSVEYVRAVHDKGAFVYYLTGRHVGGMEVGTVRALVQHGYPMFRGRTTLHLKPNFHLADKPYKDMALADLRSHHGEVVATFENEPGNANMFHGAFPDGLHFLLLTEHSPDAEAPDAALIETDDFLIP